MLTGVRLIFAALLLGATTTAAVADDDKGLLPWGLSANLAFTNDYVFRGFTQTQEDIAVQGGLDWDSGMGIYLGAWASNVKPFGIPGEGDVELDLYGGYKGTIGNLSYNWWEASAKVGYDFGFAALSGSVNYTPDFFGGLDDGWYYAAKVAVPIPAIQGLTFDATIGKQDLKSPITDIIDYSIGVSYAMKWFNTEVRYIDTDGDRNVCKNICDSRFVVKVSRSF
jgi:hypothetical protein